MFLIHLFEKHGSVLFGYCSPAFRSNLFVGTAINFCHAEFIEASINNQSFDKLRMTQQKVFPLQSGLVLSSSQFFLLLRHFERGTRRNLAIRF